MKSSEDYHYVHELYLEVSYYIENTEYSESLSRLIGFIRKDDHTYDIGNVLDVYVNGDDYNDVVLYPKTEYEGRI